jgi:hypothetical protein
MNPRIEYRALLMFAVMAASVGCANMNSIFRQGRAGGDHTFFVDARQRVVNVNVDDKRRTKVCSEKFPDALAVAAESGKLSITNPQGFAGSGEFARSEQAGEIAFKTQLTETQQVLLYYYCQLNANGTISDADVENDLARFQNTMLAMLAVEQLTGVAKTSQLSLTGSTSDSKDDKGDNKDDKTKADTKKKQDDANKKQDDAKKKAEDAAAKTEKAKASGDPVAIAKAQEEQKQAETEFLQAQKGAKAAQQDGAGGGKKNEKKDKADSKDDATKASEAVANAVTMIVQTAVWQTFTTETCLKALFSPPKMTYSAENHWEYPEPMPSDLRRFCINHLESVDEFRRLGLELDSGVMPRSADFVAKPGGPNRAGVARMPQPVPGPQ